MNTEPFSFTIKNRFILPLAGQLAANGLGAIGIDLRREGRFSILPELVKKLRDGASAKEIKTLLKYPPRSLTQGFFKSNHTDALFTKLKNENLSRHNENYLGQVLELARDRYTAILLQSPRLKLKLGDKIKFCTPEGRTRSCTVERLQNSRFEEVEVIAAPREVALIAPVAGVSVKSAVYLLTKGSEKTTIL